MATKEVIALLKKYISLLNAEGISVNRAFLFGSYTTNTASETSDIDVMIVPNNYNDNDDEVVGKIWSLTRKINTKIEPFIISLKKFSEDNSSPLVSKIKESGIEII